MHRSRLGIVLLDFDEPDHDKGLAFWTAATGATTRHATRHPEFHALRSPALPVDCSVQRINGPSRVHLDIETDDVAAEVARLEAAGATKVELVDEWQVMRDPAGLLFCVIPAYDGALTEANSVAWP